MNRTMIQIVVLCVCMVLLMSCTTDSKSATGFRLPDGDAEVGQSVFVELQCNTCHRIDGLELPEPIQTGPVRVTLGGRIRTVKTYGQLVSSIINPSHKLVTSYGTEILSVDGKSLMTNYNDRMTVQQLIDLVAFLQSRYDVVLSSYTYPVFRSE